MTTFALTLPKERSLLREILLAFGASLLIAMSAPIKLHLPFTPVPLVIQSHLCLFAGLLFGARGGFLTVLFLFLECFAGLPVFASGGMEGFFGPLGGYRVGYLVGATVTGFVRERLGTGRFQLFTAMMSGSVSLFLCGVPHLALFVGGAKALTYGLYPFIPGDILKNLICVRLFGLLKPKRS